METEQNGGCYGTGGGAGEMSGCWSKNTNFYLKHEYTWENYYYRVL